MTIATKPRPWRQQRAANVAASQSSASRVPHVLLFLYLVSKPFYFWSSGLPQVADGFLLILIGHTALSRKSHGISPWSHPVTILTALFAYWSTLVNLTAAIAVGSVSSFMLASAMNIYNAAVVVTVFILIVVYQKGMIRALYFGAIGSIGLQALMLASGVAAGGAVRAAGTFNNPNQLAFHALLILSIVLVSHHLIAPRMSLTMIAVVFAIGCALASLSRSGLIAIGVVLLGAALWPPGTRSDRRKFRALCALGLVPIAVVAGASDFIRSSQWFHTAYARATKLEPLGFETNRGYDRITNYPEYWIFGAGDGAYVRFGPHEFHSTLGNVQLSYGAIGLTIYIAILWVALRRGGFISAYVLLGTVVYGLAHNGLRSSVAWILVVLLVFATKEGFRTPVDGSVVGARQWESTHIGKSEARDSYGRRRAGDDTGSQDRSTKDRWA